MTLSLLSLTWALSLPLISKPPFVPLSHTFLPGSPESFPHTVQICHTLCILFNLLRFTFFPHVAQIVSNSPSSSFHVIPLHLCSKRTQNPTVWNILNHFFFFFFGGWFFFPSQELCSAIYQGCSWAMLCNTASRQWLTHIFRTTLKGLILGLQLPHFMCAPIRQPEGSLWAFFPIPDFFFCPETDVSNETRDWLSLMRGCFSPFGLDMKTLLFSH